jgi:hypothetical protein
LAFRQVSRREAAHNFFLYLSPNHWLAFSAVFSVMNHAEEQLQELEALASIYGDEDFILLQGDPSAGDVVFQVKLNAAISSSSNQVIRLQFELPPQYPEAPARVRVIQEQIRIFESQEKALQQQLEEVMTANAGTAVGFAIVEHARQWMQDEGLFEVEVAADEGNAASDSDSEDVFEDEDIARTVIHDRVPRVGTAVTMESFIAWRDAFEAEMAAAAGGYRDPRESKKTGKQLFEENADLARSDMGVTDADVFEAELADLPDGDELEALLAGGASFS